MRSNKHIKMLLIGMIASMELLLGEGMTAPTAHAATWHNGTPTVLRGTWKTKTLTVGPGIKTQLYWKLGKSYMMTGGGLGDGLSTNRTAYHHKAGSRYYYVRGHENINTAGHEVEYYRFYKVGNKFKATNYLRYYNGKFSKGYASEGHVYYK